MWPFSNPNVAVIASKREERSRCLANAGSPDKLTPEAQAAGTVFLKATAPEIVAHIQSGEWTASQVLEAYIARAALAHEKTNCLTEVFFDRGRQRTKELDDYFSATGKLKGPLHGVPISIKDQFAIEGIDNSIGFSQWTGKPATKNADIINILLNAGAVLYVKTNVPQTMLAFECRNPVFGRTTNPWNDGFTCGGSSGGEAALLAMDGAAIGIGSDIGGSLRIPAAYCGIYSLKPGYGRMSYYGGKGPTSGFEGIKTVLGPMARSVKDLVFLSKVTFGQQGTMYDIAPVPFREVTLPAKLKFGYYTSDKVVKASPACKRAVLEAVEALRKQGHECVEVPLPAVERALQAFVGLTSADGYKTLLSHLGPDEKDSSLFLATLGPKLPAFIRAFATWLIEKVQGDKLFAGTLRQSRTKPVNEYWKITAQKDEYIRDFYEQVWDKYALDGIIAPVQAVPQLPHGGCDQFSPLAIGTILYNVLDMPVGCLPVTRVDPVKDQVTDEWKAEDDHGSRILEQGVYEGSNRIYNPEASKGLPVTIQIVGKKWEDEKVLAIMKVVDDALGKERGFGPGSWDKYISDSA